MHLSPPTQALAVFVERPSIPVPTESRCDSSHLVTSAGFLSFRVDLVVPIVILRYTAILPSHLADED